MRNNRDNQDTKRRSTFAILFYINHTKIRKDGTCQLLCKVSIDAEWEQIGTKASVNPDIWNPETGRADGRNNGSFEECFYYTSTNQSSHCTLRLFNFK